MKPSEKLALLKQDVELFATATPETPLASLPDWGSLAILLIILHLEEKHRLAVAGSRLRACRTVGDLLDLIP